MTTTPGIEPSLAEIMRLAMDSRLLDLHVALPCRVEKYDAATQTVEVLPMVRRALTDTDGGTQNEDLPILPNVPVLFPRSANFSATWPISPGDFVLVIFCSSAIGTWRATGQLSDPVDLRRHDLSHAVAIPGVAPDGATIPTAADAALLEVGGSATHVQVGAAATDFVSLSGFVDSFLENIASAINSGVPAPNDGGLALKNSIMVALQASGWGSGGTTIPNSTAATKLKSE